MTRMSCYPVDNVVRFVNTCPLDSDLAGGYRTTGASINDSSTQEVMAIPISVVIVKS